ncbi:MAG: DUF465 domain-containing protein [Alphaproteobacteria bacterium]|nr:DUF465 domain-containing protein [Alphaproteobacteria bacterium]
MDRAELERRLIEMRTEHGDLDSAVAALMEKRLHDHVKVKRLKKRKLALRDIIRQLEGMLYPDIIA